MFVNLDRYLGINMILKEKFVAIVLMVSMLPIQLYAESVEFQPLKGSKDPSVSFNFEGEIFQPVIKLHKESNQSAKSEVEEFLSKFLKANREGDKKTFVSLYAPDDRQQMQEFVDGDLWEDNVRVAKTEISADLLAVMHYGDYLVCIVVSKYSNFDGYSEMVYPVIKTSSGELYMSQDLGSDAFVSKYAFLLANELTTRLIK